MAGSDDQMPSFEVSHEGEASDTLLVGLAETGMAGLTAAQYVVEHLGFERRGHVSTDELPSITPFEGGVPRHHTRLFSRDDVDLTVLTGELLVPLWVARSFSDSVLEWTRENDVREIVFMSGVALPHRPDEHAVYYVATEDYRESRLVDSGVPPMAGGFLEGVSAELVQRGIDSPLSVGVFVTPVHPVAQDVEAAVRLLEGFDDVYGFGVDRAPLEDYAEHVNDYYTQLAERIDEERDGIAGRVAEDRMFI
ncbi:MAG: proteasome assembly chaperone family protein [Halobacteriota archaeon]